MKKIITIAASASLLLGGIAFASGDVHWGYEGAEAPANWGQLSEKFAICSSGKNQSPINIENAIEAELAPISVAYKPSALALKNNGHTVQANYDAGSSITVEGRTFNLLQFHFHSPSENAISGKLYPMEVHFVHADADKNLAVIGVMFEEGAENEALKAAWDNMPAKAGDEAKPEGATIDAAAILPANQDYYRFNGSLTTPPCSEGVLWMVMKNPVTASKAQVEKFYNTFGHDTNRPVQPTNARPVLQ